MTFPSTKLDHWFAQVSVVYSNREWLSRAEIFPLPTTSNWNIESICSTTKLGPLPIKRDAYKKKSQWFKVEMMDRKEGLLELKLPIYVHTEKLTRYLSIFGEHIDLKLSFTSEDVRHGKAIVPY